MRRAILKFDPQTAITNFETLEQAQGGRGRVAAHAHPPVLDLRRCWRW